MEFNLETFVESYTTALKANDTNEIVNLIGELKTDENKSAGLAGVIAALEADPELAEVAATALKGLKEIAGKRDEAAETIAELAAEEPNLSAEVEVAAPAITTTEVEA